MTRSRSMMPLAVGLMAVLGAAGLASAAELEGQIARLIRRLQLDTLNMGVHIVDLETGDSLAARAPDKPYIPASNQKLLTSGVALSVFGPDHQFATDFRLEDDRLWIVGSGDPGFADPELLDDMCLNPAAFIDAIVRSMQAAEVAGVTSVVIDDRVFDRMYIHDTWPTDQLSRWYCAQVSGFNFHANVLRVYASARRNELITFDPAVPWLDIERAVRRTTKGKTAVGAERAMGSNNIRVFGSIRNALVEPIEVTVHEGSLVFARLLADAMHRAGLTEGIPSIRLATPTDPEATGRSVALVKTPIATVLERCNNDSHNLYAEALCKALGNTETGQPGSWANGGTVIRTAIRDRVGPTGAQSIVVADGSGMSRANRLTARSVTAWLSAMWSDETLREPFLESLATPGNGTLRRRFRQTSLDHNVHAKSGYLSGVRTLSGYVVDDASGRAVAFSLLVNNVPAGRHTDVKKLHEQIIDLIDDWVGEQTAERVNATP